MIKAFRKAFIALLAALLLLLNIPVALAAPVTTNGGTTDTVISVTVSEEWLPVFTITIPASVTVPYNGPEQESFKYFDIEAEGVIDTHVEITIDGAYELKKADWVEGDVKLGFGIFNTDDFDGDRGDMIGAGGIIATFDADGTDTICIHMSTDEWDKALTNPGTYTGTITFTIAATEPETP